MSDPLADYLVEKTAPTPTPADDPGLSFLRKDADPLARYLADKAPSAASPGRTYPNAHLDTLKADLEAAIPDKPGASIVHEIVKPLRPVADRIEEGAKALVHQGASAARVGSQLTGIPTVDQITEGARRFVGGTAEDRADVTKNVIGGLSGMLSGVAATRTLTDEHKRRELERGIDDAVTLGYGQRAVDKVTGGRFSATAADDAAAAPDFRPTGNLIGQALPGASKLIGKAAGNVAGGLFKPATTALGATVKGAAQAAAGYELAAPVTAALAADSEGHRIDAARNAATDPIGLATSVALGGGSAGAARAIQNSRGAQARRFIEEAGGGAKVGVTSPGKGGVFERELAGVPASDAGIGQAEKIGAEQITSATEDAFKKKHGLGYREGPEQIKAADEAYRGDVREAKADIKEARASANSEAKTRAAAALEAIEQQHKVETSRPYRALQAKIDNSHAAIATRDVTPIVVSMQDAVNDLSTAPFVRGQLEGQLKILENYRDPVTGDIKLPERQLNGLRRTLMRSAKVGMNDAPGEAEAPLRAAAFKAKELVDAGPYRELNELYAKGSKVREAAREGLGLKPKQPKDRIADEARLAGKLRRSVDDETLIPAQPSGVPTNPADLADMSGPRTRVQQAQAAQNALAGARDAQKARVNAALTGAEGDRQLLGLSPNISPDRAIDINKIGLNIGRPGQNSLSAGRDRGDINAFRAAHPELIPATDLPALARARADLAFRLLPQHGGLAAKIAHGVGGGGGLAAGAAIAAHAGGPLALLPIAAHLGLTNRTAINGRILAPLAQAAPQAGDIGQRLARAIQAARNGQQPE